MEKLLFKNFKSKCLKILNYKFYIIKINLSHNILSFKMCKKIVH